MLLRLLSRTHLTLASTELRAIGKAKRRTLRRLPVRQLLSAQLVKQAPLYNLHHMVIHRWMWLPFLILPARIILVFKSTIVRSKIGLLLMSKLRFRTDPHVTNHYFRLSKHSKNSKESWSKTKTKCISLIKRQSMRFVVLPSSAVIKEMRCWHNKRSKKQLNLQDRVHLVRRRIKKLRLLEAWQDVRRSPATSLGREAVGEAYRMTQGRLTSRQEAQCLPKNQ